MVADDATKNNPEISTLFAHGANKSDEIEVALRRAVYHALRGVALELLSNHVAQLGGLQPDESPDRLLLRIELLFGFLRYGSMRHELQGRN